MAFLMKKVIQDNKIKNVVCKMNFCNWEPKIPKHKIIIDKTTYKAAHPIWNMKDAENVPITHVEPKTIGDYYAMYNMRLLRFTFDFFTKYNLSKMNEKEWMRRCIFLETVAGVPGMVGGMLRHLRAIRLFRDDGGWIHHLLEEAENERMHLMTFLKIRQPGVIMRTFILAGQLVFLIYFSAFYLIAPRAAHRFVGYLEEEACKTYTHFLHDLSIPGKLPAFDIPALEMARKYWGLDKNAKFRDVILAIRADESAHREYNHHFADMRQTEKMEGHKIITSMEDLKWDEEEDNKSTQGKKEEQRKRLH
jgi:hypothetical protein